MTDIEQMYYFAMFIADCNQTKVLLSLKRPKIKICGHFIRGIASPTKNLWVKMALYDDFRPVLCRIGHLCNVLCNVYKRIKGICG